MATGGAKNRQVSDRTVWHAYAALVTVLWIVIWGGCQGEPHGPEVHLSGPQSHTSSPVPSPAATPVRVAVAPVISPRQAFALYRPVIDYVSDRLQRPVEMLQRATYAEVNDLIRYGRADVAFVCDYAFMEGQRDFGMEALVVPVVMGHRTYCSYIIVPRESKAKDIFDLKGKSFAFSDPLSSSGWLFPAHLLAQRGETPETFFVRHIFTYSHDNTIKAVSQRLVDGGAVDSLIYEYMLAKNAQYQGRTKVIQQSSPWGNPPVVVHPKIDPHLRQQLQECFLQMHQDKEGRQALGPLMIDRFVLPDAKAYEPVRRMAEEAAGLRTERAGAAAGPPAAAGNHKS